MMAGMVHQSSRSVVIGFVRYSTTYDNPIIPLVSNEKMNYILRSHMFGTSPFPFGPEVRCSQLSRAFFLTDEVRNVKFFVCFVLHVNKNLVEFTKTRFHSPGKLQ